MGFRISGLRDRGSLRTRFALGLGAVLLPFLAAAAVGQFYLLPRLIEPFDDIVREHTEEMLPAARLQTALLQSAMPIHDYLISGDPDKRRRFAQLRQRVERAFGEASPERFTLTEERALIVSARVEWVQALPLAERLLRLPAPVGNAAAARDMERLDAHIDRAVSDLDEAHDHFRQVIDENRTQARTARTKALWVTFAAFVLAALVSLSASAVLANSLLPGLDALGKATALLAGGDLSARALLDRKDELGQLALAFNAMAEKLEKNEAVLRALAASDALTGLCNHRTFHMLLKDELARAQRFTRPVSLLLLDIDHFKRVNDTYGHQAGDAVLKALGELLGGEARAIDRVCRYGGEEFTVILPETPGAVALAAAERIRAAIAARPIAHAEDRAIAITASIGVASFPEDADSAERIIAAADRALYAAKHAGRNRTIRYTPAPDPPPAAG